MPDLGIHVNKKATAASGPVVAASGIPFAVGTAPVHTAARAKPNCPVLCTSWREAVEKLGFSNDWKKYTLCEVMYNHFQLYEHQPVIFCNVLDPSDTDMRKPAESKSYDVADHRISLPFETILDGLKITSGEGESATELHEDEDYVLFYDGEGTSCVIELLEDSAAYMAASLTVEAAQLAPDTVTMPDIVMGIDQVDACLTAVGVIPDLLLSPGWSQDPVVAAVLATKAAGINGLFGAKCLIDIDSTGAGVTEYSQLTAYKNKNNLVDVNQIVCWPQVKLGDHQFHLSTQLAGLMASVDTQNGGCPYESPSNKNLKIDGCCLADGAEVNLTWEQVNLIAGSWGVVTAINFIGTGWTAKGNYTACFPASTDVKDQFIPVSRMFDWVGNTLIRTFWAKLDKPMDPRLRDNILDSCNIWLNGQVAAGHLLGARAVILAEENPASDLEMGIIHIHIYLTPPSPMQTCDFTLEYWTDYVTEIFS